MKKATGKGLVKRTEHKESLCLWYSSQVSLKNRDAKLSEFSRPHGLLFIDSFIIQTQIILAVPKQSVMVQNGICSN